MEEKKETLLYDQWYNFVKSRQIITPLCGMMLKNGSDKGLSFHNYTELYHHLWSQQRYKIENLLEIGIGTNDVSMPSNMGPHGVPGASLRGWKEFFPLATIHGGDIDRKCFFEEDRIVTCFCD